MSAIPRVTRPLAAALAGFALVPTLIRASPLRPLLAVQGNWIHLGMRQLNFRDDHDVVRTASDARFKRIRLAVDGGDLEIFDVRFTFGDGSNFSPGTRFVFKGASRSHVIVLPGAAHVIRWVDFYYRAIPAGRAGKATVHLYGRS